MSKNRRADIEELCAMFKALSNPQRLRIFVKIAECGRSSACDASDDGTPLCVGEFGEELGIVPSTVSHHIKELRQAGLIKVQRRGQRIECRASADALRVLAAFFGDAVAEQARRVAAGRSPSTRRR